MHTEPTHDVLVIGGGNAGICAALAASRAGARVLLLEAAPRSLRGGNSRHTRNLRCLHRASDELLSGSYEFSEYWEDLMQVTEGRTNEELARVTLEGSAGCREWMVRHGARFQPAL